MAADNLTRLTTLNAMVSRPFLSLFLPLYLSISFSHRLTDAKFLAGNMYFMDAHNLLRTTPDACHRVRHSSLPEGSFPCRSVLLANTSGESANFRRAFYSAENLFDILESQIQDEKEIDIFGMKKQREDVIKIDDISLVVF